MYQMLYIRFCTINEKKRNKGDDKMKVKSYYLTGSQMTWESEELSHTRDVLNQVQSIWNMTELDIDALDKDELIGLLSDISFQVNEISLICENELNRLIKRDANVNSTKVCSHCEDDNIWVCEPCMNKWADSVEEVNFDNV
jgi:hypothetical protein